MTKKEFYTQAFLAALPSCLDSIDLGHDKFSLAVNRAINIADNALFAIMNALDDILDEEIISPIETGEI